jgi:RNA polymerase sigma-70 factor (ECF subfamily)
VIAAAGGGAGGPADQEVRKALSELCELYWRPIYALARRAGHSRDDAADLIHGFVEWIVASNALVKVQPELGRFRNWLKAAFENFMANEARRARALKRGGGFSLISIEDMDAEERHGIASADHLTPEQAYLCRWARAVSEHAVSQLRKDYEADGRLDWFEQLRGFLDGNDQNYEDLARELTVPPPTLRKRVHKMRERFNALLRAEVEHTVARRSEVDDELRQLISLLVNC